MVYGARRGLGARGGGEPSGPVTRLDRLTEQGQAVEGIGDGPGRVSDRLADSVWGERRIRVGGQMVELRRQAMAYVRGLLAGLERKNGWTLAEFTGDTSPDAMQRLSSIDKTAGIG